MRTSRAIVLALLATVATAAPASAVVHPVPVLTAPFAASDDSVHIAPDGVHLGPYTNGGVEGGWISFSGANGLRLREIVKLTYVATYATSDRNEAGAPWVRILLDGGRHVITYHPAMQFEGPGPACPCPESAQSVLIAHVVTSPTLDGFGAYGTRPFPTVTGEVDFNISFGEIKREHPNDVVTGIDIVTGLAPFETIIDQSDGDFQPNNVVARVTGVALNDDTYCFDCGAGQQQTGATQTTGVIAAASPISATQPVPPPATTNTTARVIARPRATIRRSTARGTAVVTTSCFAACRATATVSNRAVSRRYHLRNPLARRTVRIPRAAARTFGVRLSARSLRTLRRAGVRAFRATVRVTARDARGQRRSVTRGVRIRVR